ncbi:glutathione S-transferase family protein [Phormidesmis sp. 146-35]
MLSFWGMLLGDRPYFGSHQLTLADIVAGTIVPLLPRLGISLAACPQIKSWHQRIVNRESWQKTQLDDAQFTRFRRRVNVLVRLRRRSLLSSSKKEPLLPIK